MRRRGDRCDQSAGWKRIKRSSLHKIWGNSSGQTMLEYVIIAGMLTAMVAILAVFLYVFREHSGRVLNLLASEYP
ncbi:MAG: Flp family type IVb pilin [Kiritimatiellia bacterium]